MQSVYNCCLSSPHQNLALIQIYDLWHSYFTYGRYVLIVVDVLVKAVVVSDLLVPDVAVKVLHEVELLAVLLVGLVAGQGEVNQLEKSAAHVHAQGLECPCVTKKKVRTTAQLRRWDLAPSGSPDLTFSNFKASSSSRSRLLSNIKFADQRILRL